MKVYLIVILIFVSKFLFAQNNTLGFRPLDEKVKEAELIFEGRVVAQKSFWNLDNSMILTSNLLVPLKWFKGNYRDTIEIITLGGIVDGRFVNALHTFQLKTNSDYFLFLKQEDATYFKAGRNSYFPINLHDGVVVINTNGGPDVQQDRKRNYNDIANELYKPVATIIGTEYKIFGKNHHEEINEKAKRKRQLLDSIHYQRTVIEATHWLQYHFSGVSTILKSNKNVYQFSIQVESLTSLPDKNMAEKLVSASVYLNYDTTGIGSFIYKRGLFSASASNIFSQRGYSVSVNDTTASIIKITVSSSIADSLNLFILNKGLSDLVLCQLIQPESTKYNKLEISFNFSDMVGRSEFWDPALKGTKKLLEWAIRANGYRVVTYSEVSHFIDNISKHTGDLVFPYYFGVGAKMRQTQVQTVCENYGIRFVGSDSYARAVTTDKVLAKDLCRSMDILSPNCKTLFSEEFLPDISSLAFPVIVKPRFEGDSIGITAESVFKTEEGVIDYALSLFNDLKVPVIIEEFIEGQEMSAAIIGYKNIIKKMGFIEYLKDSPVYSYADKRHKLKLNKYRDAENHFDTEIKQKIIRLFSSLDKLEFARVDFIYAKGAFFNIEITVDPTLSKLSGMYSAFKNEMSFTQFVGFLIDNCLQRYAFLDK